MAFADKVKEKSLRPIHWRLYFAVAAICLGPISMGTAMAYPSEGIKSMVAYGRFEVTEEDASWIGSIFAIGAVLGSLISGVLMKKIGTKRLIHISSIPMILSWIIIVAAPNVLTVLIGRIITGICMGIFCQCAGYIAEISPPQVRGAMGGCFGCFVTIGFVIGYGVGIIFDWVWAAGILTIPAVVMLALLFMIPESPYWFLMKNRKEDATKALLWLRGRDADVLDEVDEIRKGIENKEKGNSESLTEIFLSSATLKPLFITLMLMLFQQLCGICAISVYASDIFESAGSSIEPGISALITGFVQFCGTITSLLIVDRAGRKVLFCASGGVMAVNLAILGYYFMKLGIDGPEVNEKYGWLPLCCLIGFVFMYNIGFGPLPWLMMGELNTTEAKTICFSIVACFVWGVAFLVIKYFGLLISLLDKHGTYWLFAVCSGISVIYTIFFVPETKGKTLQEMQKYFSSGNSKKVDEFVACERKMKEIICLQEPPLLTEQRT